MSRWGASNGNTSGWGDGLEGLSNSEALEWCEHANIDTDIVEKYFEVNEG